jgi:hypothetical protein
MNHSTFDVVFHYLRYVCIHYEVSKANKKKIKQLIEAMPYFLPYKYQNLFFDLIRTYPLDCYWDSCETLQDYGYLLYSSFHKKLKKSFKSREDYDEEMYDTNYGNHKRIHSILFFIITIILLYVLYRLR